MKKILYFLLMACFLISCKQFVYETRGDCLKMELFPLVADDGKVNLDIALNGNNEESYKLELYVNDRPIDNWYEKATGSQPKLLDIPSTGVLHLVIPEAVPGSNQVKAVMSSPSFQAQGVASFEFDNISISADMTTVSGGYEIAVSLVRGDVSIAYGIDVTLDGSQVEGLEWKRPQFNPDSFRFDNERRVIFFVPKQAVGLHSLAIRVFSGYLSSTATLLLNSSGGGFSAIVSGEVEYVNGHIEYDVLLVDGDVDTEYSISAELDGLPYECSGEGIDVTKFKFPSGRVIHMSSPFPDYDRHTLTVVLSDGFSESRSDKSFQITNALSGELVIYYAIPRFNWGGQEQGYFIDLNPSDMMDDIAYNVSLSIDGHPFTDKDDTWPAGSVTVDKLKGLYVPRQGRGTHVFTLTLEYGGKTWDFSASQREEVLWFEIIDGGQVVWASTKNGWEKPIEYSRDGGRTWTTLISHSQGNGFNVNSGNYILFRGDATAYAEGKDPDWSTDYVSFVEGLSCAHFQSSATYYVCGELEALLHEDNGPLARYALAGLFLYDDGIRLDGKRSLLFPERELGEFCFAVMFAGAVTHSYAMDYSKLPRMKPLDLHWTQLKKGCYLGMYASRSLSGVPALAATKMEPFCYASMFEYANLNGTVKGDYLRSTELADYCYMYLFAYSDMNSAPVLPARTMKPGCYYSMFKECRYLSEVQALPAMELAMLCYARMFETTSIKQAPALPATTLAESCYYGMFYGCSELVAAPALPATTLADGCYREMFSYATALASAPALPATNLAEECYWGMFQGCTSLTVAPALPARTLARSCYYEMFYSSGIINMPQLNAMELAPYCYYAMFEYSKNLNDDSIRLPARQMKEHCYEGMFRHTGIRKMPDLHALNLADYCYREMFRNCSIENYDIPNYTTGRWEKKRYSLPATTLAVGCYEGMFAYNSSLEYAPSLGARKLEPGCYRRMFYYCSSLKHVIALFDSNQLKVNGALNDMIVNKVYQGEFHRSSGATWTWDDWPNGDSGSDLSNLKTWHLINDN